MQQQLMIGSGATHCTFLGSAPKPTLTSFVGFVFSWESYTHTYIHTSCSCFGSVKVTNILCAFLYQHASKHELVTWSFDVFGLLVVFQQHKHPPKHADQSHMKPRVFRSKENDMPLAGTPRCLAHTLAVF